MSDYHGWLGWLVSLSRFMKIFNFNKRMGVGSVFSNIKMFDVVCDDT